MRSFEPSRDGRSRRGGLRNGRKPRRLPRPSPESSPFPGSFQSLKGPTDPPPSLDEGFGNRVHPRPLPKLIHLPKYQIDLILDRRIALVRERLQFPPNRYPGAGPGDALEIRLQVPVFERSDANARMPAPVADRVPLKGDRHLSRVPDREFPVIELVPPDGRKNQVNPTKAKVLEVRKTLFLPPVAGVLRDGDVVPFEDGRIDFERVLPLADEPRDVEPVVVSHVADGELLEKALGRSRLAVVDRLSHEPL